MRTLIYCLIALGLTTVTCVSAKETPPEQTSVDQLIRQAANSLSTKNYRLHLLHRVGESVDTLINAHAMIDGQEREYISYLNGIPREVFRRGDSLMCVYPEGTSPMADHNLISNLMEAPIIDNYDQLVSHYQFTLGEKDYVAGREALTINITPRDSDRSNHRLWIDEASKLPLRHDVLDEHGAIMKQLMVVSIELDAVPGSKLTVPLSDYRQGDVSGEPTQHNPGTSTELRWAPRWIPDGFVNVSSQEGSSSLSGHLLYSDGLARFSIYLAEGVKTGFSSRILKHQGNVVVEKYIKDDLLVTVMGDLNSHSADKIIGSIYLRGPESE
ncbi:MAG: hypothetical protein CMF25_06335 [Kangiellaceae bacterium]|jgi:sigma-E factor negative regulatory protein RseB|nr:hypothetical protein [Kangiellaceae bacterium]|tara:strand:- start:3144 stop:4124 length:981 start_codon:yes stop_codon:yes gene_type:complete